MSQESAGAIARLPKWTQQIIERLEQKVEMLERMVKERDGEIEVTDTWIDEGWRGPGHKFRPLPKGALVRFDLGDSGGRQYVEVQVLRGSQHNRPAIQIMGGDMIKICPRSGNLAYVEVED